MSGNRSPQGGKGGGIGADTAAVLPGLKLSNPFSSIALTWTMFMRVSDHLISQAGWRRM